MKRMISVLLSVFMLVLMIPGLAGCAGEGGDGKAGTAEADELTPAEKNGNVIYVSAGAAIDGDGSEERPFSRMEEARDRIREIKKETGLPDGGITVILKEGTYRITEPVELCAEDSGEEGKTVTYRAEKGARVTIDGGVALPSSGFVPADEEFRSKLHSEEAKEKLLMTDLEKAGCFDLEYRNTYGWGGGIIYSNTQELFADGMRQHIARWPDYDQPWATSRVVRSVDYDETRRINYLEIPEGRAAEWEGSEIIVCGLFANGWETATTQSEWNGVSVEENLFTTLTVKSSLYGFNSDRPFFVYNIPAELDSPGEYFWDHVRNILYYYPQGDIGTQELVFSQVENYLIHGTDLSHVTFDGISFEHGRGSGITCEPAEGETGSSAGITVRNCTFRALGGCALVLKYVTDTVVADNDLYELGCAGIEVSNPDLSDRRPSNNRIENNMVRDFSQFYPTENPGITARGMGFLIAHNEVYNGNHTGILFHCGDSIVEYNICHDLCRMSGDAGAMYDGGSWAKTGNVIRFNYIYNTGYIWTTSCRDSWYTATRS